jgi:hypothetical protein
MNYQFPDDRMPEAKVSLRLAFHVMGLQRDHSQVRVAIDGAGKTGNAVAEARRQARDLNATPTNLVVSALQAQSFRRRLARAGGAIGVPVLTFEQLYNLCLTPTGATIRPSVDHLGFGPLLPFSDDVDTIGVRSWGDDHELTRLIRYADRFAG